MADRYWVGGTANWDGTAGTKWSATSGGAGGASVPTTADDVFFTNLSTGTCTIAAGNTGARSVNCTGFAGTITGTAAITVAGSVTLVAAMTYTHTGTMTFTGTGTLTTAGKTFSAVTVNGAGITLTLGDALNISTRDITITQGTFTTNNFALTASTLASSNSNVRTINLGSSAVTLSAGGVAVINFLTSTNLTFNAGTSAINLTGSSGPVISVGTGAGHTFYNVSFTSNVSTSSFGFITGTNTFTNLTFTAPSSAGLIPFSFSANQTITGTLTCAGATANRRVFISSDVLGTSRTLTVGTISAADCDFRDITLAGAASPASPTRAGDCGGNSGITFPAAKTVYRVGTNTTWAGVNSWATGSGGAGADTNFPLAQDTAVIDNSTTLTGTLALQVLFNIGSLDASTRTTGITLNHNATATRYGSYALGSGVTVSGTSLQTFSGRGTMDFTSAGKTTTFGITLNSPGGTFRTLDATTVGDTFNLARGALDLNNLTFTSVTFTSSNSNTRSIAFGTGNITVTGSGLAWNMGTQTNFTLTGTPVVNVTNATAVATTVSPGSPAEANTVSFNFTAGTYTLTLSSGNVRNLNFTGFSGTLLNNAFTIFGDLTISSGMTLASGTSVTTFASTSGTPRTIRTNGKTFDFPVTVNGAGGTFQLLDALTMGSARTLTHTNGTLDLNGFNLTVGTSGSYATAAGTKNLTFNGGTLTCLAASTTAFNNAAPTGFTTTAGTGTGTINMTAATAKTFVGGGSTFNCTLNNGGAGALTITGGNTFTTLANSVQPTSFLFTAGTTTTLTNWNINGTAGNLVTIGSATAASHTLSKASGSVTGNYLSISRSTATGGASWTATNSVDGGNNLGWVFGAFAIIASMAASEVGADTFAANAFIGYRVTAAMAASEVGPDILAADAFIGYKVLAALSASEVGPDIFEAFATIGTPTPPVADAVYLIRLRSFTERRRF